MPFSLHPQLIQDTSPIGDFPLCRILLHKDATVPWVILVPRQEGLKEIHHLPLTKQHQFLIESQLICEALETMFNPDKLNTGALGNVVPQLHVHHIARFKNDAVWPKPIWGNTIGKFRNIELQSDIVKRLQQYLSSSNLFLFPTTHN